MEGTKDLRVSGSALAVLISRTAGEVGLLPGSPPSESLGHDPYGIGGIYSTDDRYAWNREARCYSMLCESCHVAFAKWWDRGFAVCGGCAL